MSLFVFIDFDYGISDAF